MVPSAPTSPEASVLHCHLAVLQPQIAEMWKPKGTNQVQLPASTPSEASPRSLYFQHNTSLPKLLCRRHQEAERAAPPSPACRQGFGTRSIISSLSGFNGQLSSPLLPARLIYSIKRHFSLCPCLHTVIKLPLAYQSFGYPRQLFISRHGLFSRVSFLEHSFSESLLISSSSKKQVYILYAGTLTADLNAYRVLPTTADMENALSHPALQSPRHAPRTAVHPSQAEQHSGTFTPKFPHATHGSLCVSGQHNSHRLYRLQTWPFKRMHSHLNHILQSGPENAWSQSARSLGADPSFSSLLHPRMSYLPCQKAISPGSSSSKVLDNTSATENPLKTPHANEAVFQRKKKRREKRRYIGKTLCRWTQVILGCSKKSGASNILLTDL